MREIEDRKKPVYVRLDLEDEEWRAFRYIARQNQISVPKMIVEYIHGEVARCTDREETNQWHQ